MYNFISVQYDTLTQIFKQNYIHILCIYTENFFPKSFSMLRIVFIDQSTLEDACYIKCLLFIIVNTMAI